MLAIDSSLLIVDWRQFNDQSVNHPEQVMWNVRTCRKELPYIYERPKRKIDEELSINIRTKKQRFHRPDGRVK